MDHHLQRYGVRINRQDFNDLHARVKGILLSTSQPGARQLAANLADSPYPLSFIYLEVIIPVLNDIHDEWTNGPRPFSQVVAAWTLAEYLLPIISRRRLADVKRDKPLILISCVEGNQHGFGTRMLADLLNDAHYPTIYLEPPTKRRDILEQCRTHRPAGVSLSVSLRDQFHELFATTDALRREGYAGVIAAGGSALPRQITAEWKRHGIDWTGTGAMDFIAWLDVHSAAGGIEQKAA